MNNMDESWMLNYDDVFFCYHTEKGKVFDKTIDHHMLVFVHSGELTIGTKSETLHIRTSVGHILRHETCRQRQRRGTGAGSGRVRHTRDRRETRIHPYGIFW